MDVGQPTLDQLRVFVTVVDEGSFNAAARRLGRAISGVSYAITGLEAQLGVTLFERGGAKRPVLTEAGKALLTDARAAGREVDALVARVRGFRQGLEAELAIAVDVLLPTTVLAAVLREFEAAFPTVALRLDIEAMGAILALVLEGRAGIGVGGPLIAERTDMVRRAIGFVRLLAVAAPGHPLARGDARPGDTRKHLQLVLTDRSRLTEGRDFSVEATRTWRLADLGAKHALLREGIGWGNMPLHMVAEHIAAGRLVALDLPDIVPLDYTLSAFWPADQPPGPAGNWLLDRLAERVCAFSRGEA